MNPRYEKLVARLVALRARWYERFHYYGVRAKIESGAFNFYSAQLCRWRADALEAVGNRLNALEIAADSGGYPYSRVEAGIAILEAGMDRIDELETGIQLFSGSDWTEFQQVLHDFNRPPKDAEGEVIDRKTAAGFRTIVPKPFYQYGAL